MAKVVEKRLGRHRAAGRIVFADKVIEIDPRQPPREWLGTLVHEYLHYAYPDMPEPEVARGEKIIADGLWKARVRRIHQ